MHSARSLSRPDQKVICGEANRQSRNPDLFRNSNHKRPLKISLKSQTPLNRPLYHNWSGDVWSIQNSSNRMSFMTTISRPCCQFLITSGFNANRSQYPQFTPCQKKLATQTNPSVCTSPLWPTNVMRKH